MLLVMDGVQITKTPRIEGALNELQQMIAERYPSATFEVQIGTDPVVGFHLIPTVDVDDTDEVFEVVVDRLLDMQVEELLPVYVFPRQTPERIAAAWREQAAARV